MYGATARFFQRCAARVLSSPHTRGNRCHCGKTGRFQPFIPAYTGQPIRRVFTDSHFSLSSPHTRGNQDNARPYAAREPFIPAYTGQPMRGTYISEKMTFHPRIHGATDVFARDLSAFGPFIPAYTGQPYPRHLSSRAATFHPRIHGATLTALCFAKANSLSSPHTRGNLHHVRKHLRLIPFIPAYTGQPSPNLTTIPALTFHPRIHGATFFGRASHPCCCLSSPHTRGNRFALDFSASAFPFIPAYTGQPIALITRLMSLPFHPRIHGATYSSAAHHGLAPLSSPHTRGNRLMIGQRIEVLPFHPRIHGATS